MTDRLSTDPVAPIEGAANQADHLARILFLALSREDLPRLFDEMSDSERGRYLTATIMVANAARDMEGTR